MEDTQTLFLSAVGAPIPTQPKCPFVRIKTEKCSLSLATRGSAEWWEQRSQAIAEALVADKMETRRRQLSGTGAMMKQGEDAEWG